VDFPCHGSGAADAMLKAADVTAHESVGAGLCTAIIRSVTNVAGLVAMERMIA